VSEDLSSLLPYATEIQKKYIRAIKEHGTGRKAAKALGLNHSTVNDSISGLKRRAALSNGGNEALAAVPDPYYVKGTSTLVDGDGNTKLTWIKTAVDYDHMQALQKEFVKELAGGIEPARPVPPPKETLADDIMVGYPLGDHHFGMLAWGKETGDDWDTKIAKDRLQKATEYLVQTAPASKTALFCNLGDLLHTDNRTNRTPTSGHILDVDSRYARIIRFAAYGMCTSIEQLLRKHETVKVVNVPGNHDPDSASWVALVMEAYFRNEPRVIVETSQTKMLFHKFGANMIAMTHGDTMKMMQIPGIMANLQPQMWGESFYRTCWTGHVHHRITNTAKEYSGADVEAFGVLPPSDAYAASMGFCSWRRMQAIVLHKDGGELGRTTHFIRD
jgi:hypothetical protein